MDNIDLMIINVCFEAFQNGAYTVDGDFLLEKMARLYFDDYDNIEGRIESLWENNFLSSSNGQYYLTDKALQFIKKIDHPN